MDKYYLDQAGHGLPLQAFEGVRYQKGHGFFGRLISRAVLPLLRYLGGKALSFGKNLYSDVRSGKDIEDALKDRGLESLREVASDAFDRIRQSGKGIKRTSHLKRGDNKRRRVTSKKRVAKRKLKKRKVSRKKKRLRTKLSKAIVKKRRLSHTKKSEKKQKLKKFQDCLNFLE